MNEQEKQPVNNPDMLPGTGPTNEPLTDVLKEPELGSVRMNVERNRRGDKAKHLLGKLSFSLGFGGNHKKESRPQLDSGGEHTLPADLPSKKEVDANLANYQKKAEQERADVIAEGLSDLDKEHNDAA